MHRVGILALQGDVREHAEAFGSLGVESLAVRTRADLDAADMIVIPGGESTAISMLLDSSGLIEPLRDRLAEGMPAFGTCAGMILLAGEILDGRPDQHQLAAIDITVRRNAFGRQVQSFETDLDVEGLDRPFHGVFIRAPAVERVGDGVEVLASVPGGDGVEVLASVPGGDGVEVLAGVPGGDGAARAVLCRQGPVLVAAFHPELSGDPRLHELFLEGALRVPVTRDS